MGAGEITSKMDEIAEKPGPTGRRSPRSVYRTGRRKPRWPLLGAIVLGHLAVFYGLALALAPGITRSIERDVIAAFSLDAPEPAPEPPPPENRSQPDEGAQGDPGKDAVPEPVTAPSPRIAPPKPTPRPRASSTGNAPRSG
ncbi:MAG: hypothetical protein AAFR88_09120, partial [Pseudomonadota bacterium]